MYLSYPCKELLLLLLLTVIPSTSSYCQDCLYIYDNRNSSKDSLDLWTRSLLELHGTFLIKGSLDHDKVGLTFERKRQYQVLTFEIYPGQSVEVSGADTDGRLHKQVFPSPPSHTGDFRITFTVQKNSTFVISYTDLKVTRESLLFNYDNNLGKLPTVKQFYTVDSITQKTSNVNSVKFILNCLLEEPTTCQGRGTSPKPYHLQQNITLECRGTGVGPLSVSWTVMKMNPSDKVMALLQSAVTHLDPDTESTVSSRVTLQNFSLPDQSVFVCTVSTVSGLSDSVIFHLDYKRNVTVVGSNYYTKYQQGGVFRFDIVGWPLKLFNNYQIKLSDDKDALHQVQASGTEEFLTAIPPRIKVQALVFGILNNDTLNFEIRDKTQSLELVGAYTVRRVGYTCNTGEYGEGTRCIACPNNGTSPPQSSSPRNCTFSTCSANSYGVGENCTKCPDGRQSPQYSISIKNCSVTKIDAEITSNDQFLIIAFSAVGIIFFILLVSCVGLIIYRGYENPTDKIPTLAETSKGAHQIRAIYNTATPYGDV